MNLSKHTIKRTLLAAAVSTALGATTYSSQALALDLEFLFTGVFTMVNSTGLGALNNGDAGGPPGYGFRTPVAGTLSFDTVAHSGSVSIAPFSFFGGGTATATSITFSDTDGAGAGTAWLANMGFTWNGSVGIPVSLIWEAEGLQDALDNGMGVGDTVNTGGGEFECTDTSTGTDVSCSLPATDAFPFDFGALGTYALPLGPVPLATTSFNTTTIGGAACTLGCNPSGTLPLTDDSIGGNPMVAGPFPGFNANFDFTSLKLTSDGVGTITAPANVDTTAPQSPGPGQVLSVDLDVPTDVTPGGTAEYCTETIAVCDAGSGTFNWVASGTNGAANPIDVTLTETINESVVDWRAGAGAAFAAQTVKVTVLDSVAPTIDSMPADVVVAIDTTEPPTEVCFTDGGVGITDLTASDVWDADPTIEWSLDGFFPGNANMLTPPGNCSSDFGVNDNTVTWRATDTAGNFKEYEQTVTMNLPTGIVGTACEIDLTTAGDRDIIGKFTMRNASGALIGEVDTTISGTLNPDPALLCTDASTGACTNISAEWNTTQAFFGSLYFATPVRLFGVNTVMPSWTFETCLDDGSNNCTVPQLLSMTSVAADQLGAHMLFEWNGNLGIDVVLVWDIDCGEYMLTATDPDGDGVIGTLMVDGPFKGFNAAFDLATAPGEVPFAEGGFTATVPTFQNPIGGGSPPLLTFTPMVASDFPTDPGALESCIGGCPDFTVTSLMDAVDGGGAYKFTRIAYPLGETIPFWSLLRKFDTSTGEWRDWTTDSRNTVKTAPLNGDGSCPEPGSGDYAVAPVNTQLDNKLNFEDECLELTIEDNGPNDMDATVGIIKDPPGVAAVPAPPPPKAATTGKSGGTGGCSLSTAAIDPARRADWTLMGGLLAVLGLFSLRRRHKQKR